MCLQKAKGSWILYFADEWCMNNVHISLSRRGGHWEPCTLLQVRSQSPSGNDLKRRSHIKQNIYIYVQLISIHIKGTWSLHSFNEDYLSITEGTGRCGKWVYLFHEIPGIIAIRTHMQFFLTCSLSYLGSYNTCNTRNRF